MNPVSRVFSRSKRDTWTVSPHTVLVRYVDEAWTGTTAPWHHRITTPCEDVKTVVFRLDCAEDTRDDRSVIVQEAKPKGPELTL